MGLVWPCAKADYCTARIMCTNSLRKPMISDHLFKAGTVCHAQHEHCHSVCILYSWPCYSEGYDVEPEEVEGPAAVQPVLVAGVSLLLWEVIFTLSGVWNARVEDVYQIHGTREPQGTWGAEIRYSRAMKNSKQGRQRPVARLIFHFSLCLCCPGESTPGFTLTSGCWRGA